MIGPYPPPYTGWSTAIKEESDRLRERGADVRILNIGINRRVRSAEYIGVRNGLDLLAKLIR